MSYRQQRFINTEIYPLIGQKIPKQNLGPASKMRHTGEQKRHAKEMATQNTLGSDIPVGNDKVTSLGQNS